MYVSVGSANEAERMSILAAANLQILVFTRNFNFACDRTPQTCNRIFESGLPLLLLQLAGDLSCTLVEVFPACRLF